MSLSSSPHCGPQAARGDDGAPGRVAARQQLFDVEPSHDRLAGAGVVSQQETQGAAGQQLRSVNRLDLVGSGRTSDVERPIVGSNCAARTRVPGMICSKVAPAGEVVTAATVGRAVQPARGAPA